MASGRAEVQSFCLCSKRKAECSCYLLFVVTSSNSIAEGWYGLVSSCSSAFWCTRGCFFTLEIGCHCDDYRCGEFLGLAMRKESILHVWQRLGYLCFVCCFLQKQFHTVRGADRCGLFLLL